MNIVLWVVQVLLAFQAFAGGAYKLLKFDEIAKVPAMGALPRSAWGAIGVLEMVCGVLLIVPMATKWMPVLTPAAAAVLAVESFGLALLYGRYSRELAPTNPMVWVVASGLMAAFVAWGRFALRPPA